MSLRALRADHRAMHLAIPPDTRESWIDPIRCPPMRSDRLTWVGRTDSGRDYVYSNRVQPGWQAVVVDGQAEVWSAGGWLPLPAGTLYVAPPGARVGLRLLGPSSIWWTCADRGTAPPLAEPERVHEPALAALLAQTASAAIEEAARPEAASVMAHWSALLAHLLARTLAIARGQEPPSDPLVALWAAVSARPERPWTLADLCSTSALPRERLRRLCHERHGVSPLRQVAQLRLRHAAMLLGRSDLPVSEIAHRVGYARPFAFSTAFRRAFALSPRAYRAASRR